MVDYVKDKIQTPDGKGVIFVYREVGSDKEYVSLIQAVKYCTTLPYEAAETFVILYADDICIQHSNGAMVAYLLEVTEENFEHVAERLEQKQKVKDARTKLEEVYSMIKRYEMPKKACWRPESVSRQMEEKRAIKKEVPEFVRPQVVVEELKEVKIREPKAVEPRVEMPKIEPKVAQIPVDKPNVTKEVRKKGTRTDKNGSPILLALLSAKLGCSINKMEYKHRKTARPIAMYTNSSKKILAFDLISLLASLQCGKSPESFLYELRGKQVIEGLDRVHNSIPIHFEWFSYTCDLIRFSAIQSSPVAKNALKLSYMTNNVFVLEDGPKSLGECEASKETVDSLMSVLMDSVGFLGKGTNGQNESLTNDEVKQNIQKLIRKLEKLI